MFYSLKCFSSPSEQRDLGSIETDKIQNFFSVPIIKITYIFKQNDYKNKNLQTLIHWKIVYFYENVPAR